jgi:serine/threonine-protein kinase
LAPASFARPSFPDELRDPPQAAPPRVPRWVLVAGCFAIGAALTAFGAHALGVFDRTASGVSEPTAQSYADRANAAIAADAWDTPPGENVRDLTDAALRRWPGAPQILEVRQNAARMLVRRAHDAAETKGEDALRWARLAAELDSGNAEARALAAELASPSGKPSASADEGPPPKTVKSSREPPPKKRSKTTTVKTEPGEGPIPSEPPRPKAAADAGAGSSSGGRWL